MPAKFHLVCDGCGKLEMLPFSEHGLPKPWYITTVDLFCSESCLKRSEDLKIRRIAAKKEINLILGDKFERMVECADKVLRTLDRRSGPDAELCFFVLKIAGVEPPDYEEPEYDEDEQIQY